MEALDTSYYFPENLLNDLFSDDMHSKQKAVIMHVYSYFYIKQNSLYVTSDDKKFTGVMINSKDIASKVYGTVRIIEEDKTKQIKCYFRAIKYLLDKMVVFLVKMPSGASFTPYKTCKRYGITLSSFDNTDIVINIPDSVNKFLKKLPNPTEDLFHDKESFSILVDKLNNSNSIKNKSRLQMLNNKGITDEDANQYTEDQSSFNLFITACNEAKLESDSKFNSVNIKKDIMSDILVFKQKFNHTCKTLCDRTKEIINNVVLNKFDIEGFKQWTESMCEKSRKQMRISMSMMFNSVASRKKSEGRLYSSFTNLKKDIRDKFINYKWSIDVANSQFVLLSMLIKEHTPYCDSNSQKFFDLCSRGELYSYLSNKCNITRSEAKIGMFKILFNPKIYRYRRNLQGFHKLFQSEFGQIMEWVMNYSYVNRKSINLATALQIKEASIFIDSVLAKFINTHNILSIHDSIYSFDDTLSKDDVIDHIKTAYLSKGMPVTLHYSENGSEEIDIYCESQSMSVVAA